jgi:hypothetical protein
LVAKIDSEIDVARSGALKKLVAKIKNIYIKKKKKIDYLAKILKRKIDEYDVNAH